MVDYIARSSRGYKHVNFLTSNGKLHLRLVFRGELNCRDFVMQAFIIFHTEDFCLVLVLASANFSKVSDVTTLPTPLLIEFLAVLGEFRRPFEVSFHLFFAVGLRFL